MTKPDTRVAIASQLLVAVLLMACNRTTAGSVAGGDASGTDTQPPGTDAPLAPTDTASDAPVTTPADAAGGTQDGPREVGQPPDASGDGACTLPEPIAGAECDRCLTQHCCREAQQCPFLATLQGGSAFGPGCRNGLRCIRQCSDAGACRLDLPGSPVLRCSNGIGPQGGTALMQFLACAAYRCPEVCAQGL